jgi:hypothetical protein
MPRRRCPIAPQEGDQAARVPRTSGKSESFLRFGSARLRVRAGFLQNELGSATSHGVHDRNEPVLPNELMRCCTKMGLGIGASTARPRIRIRILRARLRSPAWRRFNSRSEMRFLRPRRRVRGRPSSPKAGRDRRHPSRSAYLDTRRDQESRGEVV